MFLAGQTELVPGKKGSFLGEGRDIASFVGVGGGCTALAVFRPWDIRTVSPDTVLASYVAVS